MEDLIRAVAFIISAGVVFIAAMSLEAWYLKRKSGNSNYDLKETLANIATGASYKVVDGICMALFIVAFAEWLSQFGPQWSLESNFWTFVIAFIATDFFMYCNHFIQHKVRWFWSVHVTHHSSDRMNLSTALRQNALHGLTGNWLFLWVPLALTGLPTDMILLLVELNLVYQFFLHTESIRSLGPLEYILNTPAHHRIHHGRKQHQTDSNFGGVLIIWDRLFGTFRGQEEADHLEYGIRRMPARKYDPIYLQLHELLHMFKDVWTHKDPSIFVRRPNLVLDEETEARQQPAE